MYIDTHNELFKEIPRNIFESDSYLQLVGCLNQLLFNVHLN